MNRNTLRLLGAAIVGLIAYAAITLSPAGRFAVASLVGLPSFVLMIIGRRQLGKSFSINPRATALVTTGLYSRFQHPMYLFLDLFLVSVIVALGAPILLPVWFVFVTVQSIQAAREEKILLTAFGAEYETYRDRTWC